jgi:hypothetical protein
MRSVGDESVSAVAAWACPQPLPERERRLLIWEIFGVLFLRWRRVNPMIIAHKLINSVAFIGYTLLAGHVSWLP